MTTYDKIETLGLAVDMQSWESAQSPVFKELIDKLQPKTIIEVGSWKGVSACTMALLGKPYGTHVHCVDTFLGSVDHFISGKDKLPRDQWGYPQLFHQFLTNVKSAGCSDRVTPYPMTSTDGARWLLEKKITAKLIYIDGSHHMEECYEDMKNYWPLLESGGVMFGDDVEVFAGVKAAAYRFMCEYKHQLIIQQPFWAFHKP